MNDINKNLILNKEYREKFIEMWKVLFPEYDDYKWEMTHQTDNIRYDGMIYMYNKTNRDIFHWFEFCVNYLSIKLNVSREDLMNFGLNPIDYLYEKFKQLI